MEEIIDYIADDDFFLMMTRIIIALVLSGLIGFERELKNHSAGFRTHILVGVGACLMMLLSLYGFEDWVNKYENIRFDPARIPSYVISGIGFLGAGTIIVYGGTIRGLTTAASIWTVAGLGLVVGAGMYAPAIFTTFVILLSLIFLNNLEKLFTNRSKSSLIEIVAHPQLEIGQVVSIFESVNLQIKKVEIIKLENNMINIFIRIEPDKQTDPVLVFNRIAAIEDVKSVNELK
ncbi:ATPase [Virgibacillus sp. SK37]|nr:ATPase [Virgibacillus sp. SK37]